MSNKRSGCLGIALGVVLVISLFINVVLVATRSSTFRTEVTGQPKQIEKLEEKVVASGKGAGKIARISLRGIISSSVPGHIGETMVDDIKLQLRQAVRDSSVKAIVLAIDSPGGEVTASDIIYNAVRDARKVKPVIVSMGSMAASGGYYISCGGSYLMANDTTFTGSIGVIISTFRYNDLLGKIGVEPVVFKSGAFKDMLSGEREMTPAEKDYIQGLVMQTYGKFVGIVAKERKIPEDQLRSGIADGRVVSGKDALAAKLIDALGEVEDAYAKARELGNAPDAPVIAYEEPFKFSRIFRGITGESSANGQTKVEINFAEHLMPALEPGKAYMLPGFYVP